MFFPMNFFMNFTKGSLYNDSSLFASMVTFGYFFYWQNSKMEAKWRPVFRNFYLNRKTWSVTLVIMF